MSPNLFLLAAPRSGSTQLARWLGSHPEIGMSSVKEPNFYAQHEFPPEFVRRYRLNDIDPQRYRPGRDRPAQFAVFRQPQTYADLFADLDTPWRMEASTSYLACPEAPGLIACRHPHARFISLTRDPVARAMSHHRLALRTGRSRLSLGTELEAEQSGRTPLPGRFLLRPSRQAAGLLRIATKVTADRHLSLRFEQLVTNPAATLAQVANFLAIDPGGFDLDLAARNASASPRLPRLNRLLLQSGVKTWLRRHLPPSWKPVLKGLYFNEKAQMIVTLAEREATALSGEAAALDRALALLQEAANFRDTGFKDANFKKGGFSHAHTRPSAANFTMETRPLCPHPSAQRIPRRVMP